jgi:hypothetical protein
MDPIHTALLTRIAPLVYEDSLSVRDVFRRRRLRRADHSRPPAPRR